MGENFEIEKILTFLRPFEVSLWVRLFYCTIESCIVNNGWTSNFFNLSRGVRQGCPLSPYLFILSAEILAEAIRNKSQIRDIKIQDTEFKLSQYADDTTLIFGSGYFIVVLRAA